MIFCCDFWWKNQHPKFYNETVDIMGRANKKAFIGRKDILAFVKRLRDQIERDKPKGHQAKIECYNLELKAKDGQISIVSGKLDDTIARISFHYVEKILRYNEIEDRFMDWTEAFKEGGEL